MNSKVLGQVVIAIAAVLCLLPTGVISQQANQPPAGGCAAQPPRAFHQCAQEKMKTFTPPRTADGKPDLQGFWSRTVGSLDIEQPSQPRTGDGGDPTGSRGSLIVDPPDGKLPYQPWAVKQRAVNMEKFIDPMVGCTMTGSPRNSYISPYTEIVQKPGYIAFLQEDMHQFRIVPTDGRPHLGPRLRLWGGDFRGRWDGDTLVMDVTNSNGLAWLDSAGDFASEDVHVVERYTMIARDQLHWQAVVEDPKVFTRPFTLAAALNRLDDPKFEMLEEACVEGEGNAERQRTGGRTFFPGVRGLQQPR